MLTPPISVCSVNDFHLMAADMIEYKSNKVFLSLEYTCDLWMVLTGLAQFMFDSWMKYMSLSLNGQSPHPKKKHKS